MAYTHAILKAATIEKLIKYLNGDRNELEPNEIQYFERATTFDDIKLVVLTKYMTDIIQRIKLNRNSLSITHVETMLNNLESDAICNDFQFLDEGFIKYIILKDYKPYYDKHGNLSESLLAIMQEYYQDAILF